MTNRALVRAMCASSLFLFAACGESRESDGRASVSKDKTEVLRDAGAVFGKYYVGVKALRDGPTRSGVVQGDELRSAEDCASDLQFWSGQGVDDGDAIFSYDFNAHPKAKQNTVPFSEARAICKEYAPLYARYRIAYDLYRAEGTLARMREYLKPDDPVITVSMIAEYERTSLTSMVMAALKDGRKVEPSMKVGKRGLSLDDYEAQVARPLYDVAPRWIADARAAFRKRNEKFAAPYVSAGVSGHKLDLVVSYSGVYWRLKGGERTDDPKKIARASLLFHWLETRDSEDQRFNIHTIRRYEFDGNDLGGVTERRYRLLNGKELGESVFQ
jgi:hypothetical protein